MADRSKKEMAAIYEQHAQSVVAALLASGESGSNCGPIVVFDRIEELWAATGDPRHLHSSTDGFSMWHWVLVDD